MATPELPPPAPEERPEQTLPRWFRMAIIGGFGLTAIVHLFVDVAVDSYSANGLSFLLFGFTGSAVAGTEWLSEWMNNRRNGGGNP